MKYKPGDIVIQIHRPLYGNLKILNHIFGKCYKCKYVNNTYNDGLHGETYQDAYIFHEVWLGDIVNKKYKSYLPGWF